MSIYIDTSALLAVFDADDPQHSVATDVWSNLIDRGETLVASNYVVVETISLLHRRFGVPTVNRFRMDLLPALSVEWVDEPVHSAAVSAMLASGRRGPSLVDCVSFELMRRLDIRAGFAFDKHFVDAGFEHV